MRYEVRYEAGNCSYPVFDGTKEECAQYKRENYNNNSDYVIRRKY